MSYIKILKELYVYSPTSETISTVDGKPSQVFGAVTLPLHIANKIYQIDFHILRCSIYDGILGRKFLSTYQALLNCADSVLSVDWPLDYPRLRPDLDTNISRSPSNVAALLVDSLTIPPFSEMLALVHAHPFEDGKQLLFEGVNMLTHFDVVLAASVAKVDDSVLPCRLFNTSSVPVFLPKGIQVGNLSPYHAPPIASTVAATPNQQDNVPQNQVVDISHHFNVEMKT